MLTIWNDPGDDVAATSRPIAQCTTLAATAAAARLLCGPRDVLVITGPNGYVSAITRSDLGLVRMVGAA